jgi:hypothetical protein
MILFRPSLYHAFILTVCIFPKVMKQKLLEQAFKKNDLIAEFLSWLFRAKCKIILHLHIDNHGAGKKYKSVTYLTYLGSMCLITLDKIKKV